MEGSESAKISKVDVAIIGGALSGASMGLLLKRAQPSLRVLIVENSEYFDRKVGESTSEVGSTFLHKILGLSGYLARTQLPKQGLRLWFNDQKNRQFDRCTEIGGVYQSRLPAYQLDRAELDTHLLERAVAEGCELWRPARVREVDLEGVEKSLLVKRGNESHRIFARWVVDASGKATVLARENGTLRKVVNHPTNALWARFTNVGDLDSYEWNASCPAFAQAVHTTRQLATNHLMGRGWWCWIIPLRNGEVSAGLTWDTRYFSLPDGEKLGDRLQAHLMSHPIGKMLFAEARLVENDVRTYSKLPYFSSQPMGDGWAAVGDASGFMDPLYSSGLDYCAHTVYAVHKIVLSHLAGEGTPMQIKAYNDHFVTSYERWMNALYIEKYAYLGDAELVYTAFLLDIAFYFLGPVSFITKDPDNEFARLPYQGRAAGWVAGIMRFYNQRLSQIAEKRLNAGCYGTKNLDHRFLIRDGFVPGRPALKHLRRGLLRWLWCEWKALWLRSPQAKAPPAALAKQLEFSLTPEA